MGVKKMYDQIPVLVKFQYETDICQFMVPGTDGLEIMSLMLSKKLDWDQGVEQIMSLLEKFVPVQLLPAIEQSYTTASACADLLKGVAY